MLLTEPLLPTGASASFITGLFLFRPRRSVETRFDGVYYLGREVSESHWEVSGREYTLAWGGRVWTLSFLESDPGLRSRADGWSSSLLSLHGLAAIGRFESEVFTPATLVNVERYRSRVQATFGPPAWGGLTVRAAWSPSLDGTGVDLEVQASASSVGELRSVEVVVQSEWRRTDQTDLSDDMDGRVTARDPQAAALSYDGREAADNLRRLTMAELGDSLWPGVFIPPGGQASGYYVEMVQPNDAARQIRLEPSDPELPYLERLIHQYALFGHDMEKGVVFRARLRACWLGIHKHAPVAVGLYREFLNEPFPLGP
jgi:hypothetical protein